MHAVFVRFFLDGRDGPEPRDRSAVRILWHYGASARWQARVAALGGQDVHVDLCAEDDDTRFFELLPDAEVIWHALRPIADDELARAPALRLIQKIGVGVNTIDLEAARARGVAVCNMPGTNAPAVAEMTLLLMLACLRRLVTLDGATRAGRGWTLDPELQDTFGELGGRTVGLVGYGGIPRALSPALEALGANVIYTATAPKSDVALPFCEFPELLARSDIVSLHVPLTPDTEQLVGAEQIACMPAGSILVNTARGALVDESALADALSSGHLAAAGLDAFAREPLSGTERILRLDNVVLTPHVGWLTDATLERSVAVALENVRRLAAGRDLLHRVV
jgi:phosphoglycerate dehydrogenase-like enzyme